MAENDAEPAVTTLEALDARIRMLEDELGSARREIERRDRQERRRERTQGRRTERSDVAESTRETADRAIDETNRLFRSMTMAYVEGIRSAADAVGSFSDEFARRADDDDRERLANLPGDLYSSYLSAVNQALKIPGRAVDRFQDSYRRDERRRRPTDRYNEDFTPETVSSPETGTRRRRVLDEDYEDTV
jgi:hypothetical protein